MARSMWNPSQPSVSRAQVCRSGGGGGGGHAAAVALAALLLAACAVAPPQVAERLDTRTGVTIIALSRPIELITERNRGPLRDPYAFLGPFDTDQMGHRDLYLWVSVPEDNGIPIAVEVQCDGHLLALPSAERVPSGLEASGPPYQSVVPTGRARYFHLPQPALRCLASARRIAIETHLPDSVAEHFSGNGAQLTAIAAFAARLAGP
ncbi:MAG TPA: hypothetical protein VMU67_09645 [Steroidobacteraceae bacterium]|nr:hypothetical protein [Steroidobacteraceae bacterium]